MNEITFKKSEEKELTLPKLRHQYNNCYNITSSRIRIMIKIEGIIELTKRINPITKKIT